MSHLLVGLELAASGVLPLASPSLLLYKGRAEGGLTAVVVDCEGEFPFGLEVGSRASSMPQEEEPCLGLDRNGKRGRVVWERERQKEMFVERSYWTALEQGGWAPPVLAATPRRPGPLLLDDGGVSPKLMACANAREKEKCTRQGRPSSAAISVVCGVANGGWTLADPREGGLVQQRQRRRRVQQLRQGEAGGSRQALVSEARRREEELTRAYAYVREARES